MKERNKGLDLARFLMAFLVVCIHVPYDGYFGRAFMTLTRCAVPFFFMLSGYLMGDINSNKGRVIRQLKSSCKIALGATMLYTLWYIFLAIYQRTGVVNYIKTTFSATNIFKWIVFNEVPVAFHLWYLYAYIYVLVVGAFILKHFPRKYIYLLVLVLLLGDLAFGKYSLVIFSREFPVYYVRNFMFVGLPFFLIGNFIANNNRLKYYTTKIHGNYLIIICALTIGEYFILEHLGLNATRDHYITTTLLVIFVFCVALNYKMTHNLLLLISEWGKKYSLTIYIVQVIWINVMTTVINKIPVLGPIYKIVAPAIIFTLSLIVAILFSKLKILIERRTEENEKI